MKKIALIIPDFDNKWIGGVNYYCNLLSQCRRYEPDSVDISIITTLGSKEQAQQMLPNDINILTTSQLKRFSLAWLTRNVIYVSTGKDYLMERFLLKHHFDLVTHSPCRNYGKRIKSICWIPDLQHKYLPYFFSKKELIRREREFQEMFKCCDRIVLSSQVTMNDVVRFYNAPKDKLSVLHFYKKPLELDRQIKKVELQKKYQLPEQYFLIPNQFWAHKNHLIVLEALNLLKLKNVHVEVVCCGNTDDYRNPNYFEQLMARVDWLGLRNYFKVLGLIPEHDVNALIKYSTALINPSLFEGWSTSVEEARAYGKRIILSDIPVHREQFPPDALFFKPDSAEQLTDCIENILSNYNSSNEEKRSEIASINASKLCANFAKSYANIVKTIS